MNGIQIRVGDLLYAVIKRWKLILAIALLGLCMGAAMSGIAYMQGKNMDYEISCNVALAAKSDTGKFTENSDYLQSGDFHLAEDMVDAAIFVMESDHVLEEAVERSGLSIDDPETISKNLSITRYNETQILSITLAWNSAQDGVTLMNAILEASSETLPKTLMIGAVATIDEPEAEYVMGAISSIRSGILLCALGMIAGIGVAVLELIMRPTLLNLNDVKDVLGLETIGVIPKDDEWFREQRGYFVQDGAEASEVERNYLSIAYILRNLLGSRQEKNCFYVTSAGNGEGKSEVAANVAVQLSGMGKRVLLVDLDTDRPSLGGHFLSNVDYSCSLNAVYKGETTVKEALTSLTGTLDLLPMVLERNAVPMDDTLFELIDAISGDYQFVIIDAPSVGRNADALSLSRVAQAAIFVIRQDVSTLQQIQNAIENMEKSGIRILGCVVNAYRPLGFSGTGGGKAVKNGGKKKKRRTTDKEHMSEINAMVLQESDDDLERDLPDVPAAGKASTILEEILVESEEDSEQMDAAEAMQSLVEIGIDGSWEKDQDGADEGK